MSTNVAAASFKANLGTTPRIFGDHVGQVFNVKSFGATGDGTTNDTTAIQNCLNAAFSIVGGTLSNIVFFPSGDYKITSKLVFASDGGAICGCGKNATRIRNTTSGDTVLQADWRYWWMSDLSFVSAGGAGSICFDWARNVGDPINQNFGSIVNCAFDGGAIGARLGAGTVGGGDQASETIWINCDFINAATYGIDAANGNSLNHIFIGGSFRNCDTGITTSGGGVLPMIRNVAFSGSTFADINIGSANPIVVANCYSTSTNFLVFGGGSVSCYVIGCYHTGSGYFATSQGGLVIDGCYSTGGTIQDFAVDANTRLYLRGNRFDNAAYLTSQPYTGTIAEGPY